MDKTVTASAVFAVFSAVLLVVCILEFMELGKQQRRYSDLSADYQDALSEIGRLSSQNQALNASYSNLNATYTRLLAEHRSLNATLNGLRSDYEMLNKSYSQLIIAYSGLNASYLNLKEETERVLAKVDDYERSLRDSMMWFRTNSELSGMKNPLKEEQVEYNLRDNCYRIEERSCKIKTGCMWVVNERYLGLSYKTDIETSHSNDTLLSLQDFIKNWGGDCEDYSLFYKAEMNHIIRKCLEAGITQSEIGIEGFRRGGNENYFLDFKTEHETRYYLPNAMAAKLKEDYVYPVVICGNMYDLNTRRISGHCMIAFSRNRLFSASDINLELNKVPIIEPQTGEYMGLINDATSNIYLASDSERKENDSYIYMLITDWDLMLFDEEKKEWMSYSGFNEELEELETRLRELLS
ncbi:MAG: hypothetical protein QW112_01510 [Candidatus Micrarchaeia archaeon]